MRAGPAPASDQRPAAGGRRRWTQEYSRPDITYVPVPGAERDQVFLAWEASRRSPLIAAFVESARSSGPA
ncbi:hypothetical protein ACIBL8_01290 [Streptomyces sp. NPDC050523]|uniref:hypothetical protein n=1 Tax=Streptomyces sp. NPDC050523 TaxID=3365622 RepID=UPI00378B4380